MDRHPGPGGTVAEGTARTHFEEAERQYLDSYDVAVRTRFVELSDPALRLRIVESGEGPPALLLHSAGCFALQWLPLFPHLQDFHLFAPDMPGRGLSDRFDYRGVDVRAHGAGVVEALLDALGLDHAVVIGSSFGAYRALAVAHLAPDRVAALVLVGSPALVLDNRDVALPVRLLAVPGLGRLLLVLSSEKQERSGWQAFSGEQAVERLPDTFFTYSYREGRLPGSARTIATLFARLLTLRGWRHAISWTAAELAEIDTRTLLVWGQQDVFGSVQLAERVVEAMPDAQLALMEAGHHPWYDDPQCCAELIREFIG